MPNEKSISKRLLERLPRDKQLILIEAFRKHGIYERDPILLLFLEVLENQDKSIAREAATQRKILGVIHDPKTWQKLLLSRFLSWVLGPIIGASIVLGGIYYLRKAEMEPLKQVLKDPKPLGALLSQSEDTLKKSEEYTRTMTALVGLMNVPDATFAIRDNKMLVRLPKENFSISEVEDSVLLEFHDLNRQTSRTLQEIAESARGEQRR